MTYDTFHFCSRQIVADSVSLLVLLLRPIQAEAAKSSMMKRRRQSRNGLNNICLIVESRTLPSLRIFQWNARTHTHSLELTHTHAHFLARLLLYKAILFTSCSSPLYVVAIVT